METKKLYRSKKDRVFAGVCGGIGEYLGGVLAYIVAAILIPENPVY